MLGGSTTGYTVTAMVEQGFKLDMLTEVVSSGLARATQGTLPGEQGCRVPEMSTRILLALIDRDPDDVRRALGIDNERPTKMAVG